MDFRDFVEMSSLIDIIGKVPQKPMWHKEGPVGIHTHMVRDQLEPAILTFKKKASDPNSALSELNPNFTDSDRNILRIAAWVHDLGKASATTVDEKPWQEVPEIDLSKVKAIGHESPSHFNPMIRKLLGSSVWKNMWDNADFEDKKDLWFIIKNHMDLKDHGFSKTNLRRFLQPNGKYKNERRIKLLLTFILMDHAGRVSDVHFNEPEDTLKSYESGASRVNRIQVNKALPTSNDPMEFLQTVGEKLKKSVSQRFPNLSGKQKIEHLKKSLIVSLKSKSDKEGLSLSDEEISDYVQEYLTTS